MRPIVRVECLEVMPGKFRCLAVCLVAALPFSIRIAPVSWPEHPRTSALRHEIDRLVHLNVEYDAAFAAVYGDVESAIHEAVAIHNIEWRRFRREWFAVARIKSVATSGESDASHVLAAFLHRTTARPHALNVLLTGRQLEVYTNGKHAVAVGGLAYRGSDALLVSSAGPADRELLAYYLFHEIGHSFEAYDVPFGGGDTAFGSKTRRTFDVDAGNEEIIESSRGPAPRDHPFRAPMVIRSKLARARREVSASLYPALHDLLLHEPSPANGAYVRKKAALLEAAGEMRHGIESLLANYEITADQLRDDTLVRTQIADHYWRANAAISRRDYDAAQSELDGIRKVYESVPDVHMLVGAVERKIRRRR